MRRERRQPSEAERFRAVVDPGWDADPQHRDQLLRRLRLADAAVQSSAEGIVVADASGRILSCNPAFLEMTGCAEETLVGKPPTLLRASAHPQRRLWELLDAGFRWSGEGLCRPRDGEPFSVWLTVSAVHHGPQVTGYVALVSDMTERKLAEATIRFQASHDALTQLLNRAAFLAALECAVHEESGRLAVLFIDLDGFKAANDRHGHAVGDTLLATTARRLERCVRRSDLVCRFGGDEFTILLRGVKADTPLRVARAVVKALAAPFHIDGVDVRVSGSVGFAIFPADGTTRDALIAAADEAMYEAKRAGGSRAVRASAGAGKRPTTRAAPAARTASRLRA